MNQLYTEDQIFDKKNFTLIPLPKGEYENCVFKSCDFTGSDLTEVQFVDCEFMDCNLSMPKLVTTTYREVKFKDCKMLGMLFYNCHPFGLTARFDNCNLSHASFYQRKIKQTVFKNTRLHEVDFTECDLTGSVFEQCDLLGAKFEHTILEKADLRTAFNYALDPELNRIRKARFSVNGIAGLLGRYGIEIDHG